MFVKKWYVMFMSVAVAAAAMANEDNPCNSDPIIRNVVTTPGVLKNPISTTYEYVVVPDSSGFPVTRSLAADPAVFEDGKGQWQTFDLSECENFEPTYGPLEPLTYSSTDTVTPDPLSISDYGLYTIWAKTIGYTDDTTYSPGYLPWQTYVTANYSVPQLIVDHLWVGIDATLSEMERQPSVDAVVAIEHNFDPAEVKGTWRTQADSKLVLDYPKSGVPGNIRSVRAKTKTPSDEFKGETVSVELTLRKPYNTTIEDNGSMAAAEFYASIPATVVAVDLTLNHKKLGSADPVLLVTQPGDVYSATICYVELHIRSVMCSA